MYPETLAGCVSTLFGKLCPRAVLITTPNCEFNIVFQDFESQTSLEADSTTPKFRHWDHKFEWTRAEFQEWCQREILDKYPNYHLDEEGYSGQGLAPAGYEHVGFCTQSAVFVKKVLEPDTRVLYNQFSSYIREKQRSKILQSIEKIEMKSKTESDTYLDPAYFEGRDNEDETYSVVYHFCYPFEPYDFSDKEIFQYRDIFLINELSFLIRFMATSSSDWSRYRGGYERTLKDTEVVDERERREQAERVENGFDLYDDSVSLVEISHLVEFGSIHKFELTRDEIVEIMKKAVEMF